MIPPISPDLRQRALLPECMDQPELDPRRHELALKGLTRINAWSRAAATLWPPIAELARSLNRPLRLLDLATGAGDVPVGLALRARREGIALRAAACDLSPVAIAHAAELAARRGVALETFMLDVLRDELPRNFDVLTCSLFLHHLSGDDAEALLRRMGQAAGALVLISDLRRTNAGWWLARWGSRLLSRSEVVHIDAPRSVRAGWRARELLGMAERAGLHGARLGRHWPMRYLVTWRPPPANPQPESRPS